MPTLPKRFDLEYLQAQAALVSLQLAPFCDRIAVVGSVRRCVPYPNDVDLLLCTRDYVQVWNTLAKLGAGTRDVSSYSGPPAYRTTIGGVDYDILFAYEGNWAHHLLHFTGSRWFNSLIKERAKEKGYTWDEYGFLSRRGLARERTPRESEEDILSWLGLEAFLDPSEREKRPGPLARFSSYLDYIKRVF